MTLSPLRSLSRRLLAQTLSGQLHYRAAGDGGPVMMLGALPSCVHDNDPLFRELAAAHFVLAVDPPGHGFSDPPTTGTGLAPYIEPLADFIESLDCGPIAIVGEEYGGVLAVALLDARPDLVTKVLVQDPPDANDAPSWFVPAIDGTHLIAQWDQIARAQLFRPQTSTRYSDRILADMKSPVEHHARLIDALRAGADGERLRTMLRGFDLARASAQYDGRVFHLQAGMNAADLVPDYSDRRASLPDCGPGATDRFGKYLIDVPGGQLFARGQLHGDGALLLGLHDQAGSTHRLDAFVGYFIGSRPVLSIDMPGSGGSDAILAPADVSIETYAATVEAALEALGVDTVDVIGRYAGGQTAVELALRLPGKVQHVVNVGVMIFDDADAAEHTAHYAPSFAPVWDGSHLVTAWMAFRSQNLWWPWYDRRAESIIRRDAMLDPQILHDRIVGALAAGPFYRAAYLASFRYPMAEKLRALTVPCLLCDIANTASYARVAQGKAAAPACLVADLGEDSTRWPTLFESFFAKG